MSNTLFTRVYEKKACAWITNEVTEKSKLAVLKDCNIFCKKKTAKKLIITRDLAKLPMSRCKK